MHRFACTFVAATATTLVLVLALPAVGATTIDSDDWVSGFCDAFADWQTTALKARDLVDGVIEDGVSSSTKAKATRKKLVSALEHASEGSELASEAIDELDPPDVAGGANVSSTVSSSIASTADVFADASDDAAKFSTDPKKFRKQVTALNTHVDKGLEAATADMNKLETLQAGGELDSAIRDDPTCSSLESN